MERRQRLMSKGIIYEVKLLDWIERVDIDANGNFLKTTIVHAAKKEWEKPSETDEVEVSVKLYHFNDDPSSDLDSLIKSKEPIEERNLWKHSLTGVEMPFSLRNILETMKRCEHTQTIVKSHLVSEQDPGLWKHVTEKIGEVSKSSYFVIDCQLHSFIKIEDWFNDGTTFKRVLKKGKG
jgi:hypothetical protein